VIEEITGVIRLHSKSISLERDKYELNVTAVDDGACCVNGASTIHTSTAVVVVFITDVNDNKPVFRECAKYNPKVEEGAPNGSPVLKVREWCFCFYRRSVGGVSVQENALGHDLPKNK